MPTMDDALQCLREYWGHDDFREPQRRIIEAAIQGRDAMLVSPTGSGKSAAFQIPALLAEGTALVVTPLISLMEDQCAQCQEKGIRAEYINSQRGAEEQAEILEQLTGGGLDLLYVAPERLSTRAFQEAASQANISYLVIDEAHCVSLMGHDFRPAYMDIAETARDTLKSNPPKIAATATATPDMIQDIGEALDLGANAEYVVADPIRPNFHYAVISGNESAWSWLKTLARNYQTKWPEGNFIIYAGTRRGCEIASKVVGEVLGNPDVVDFYHAGRTKEKRSEVQDFFRAGIYRWVCATNAFGMGIDVPDVRAIIHLGICGSLEAYQQEIGRAGRDGRESQVVLIHDPKMKSLRERFVRSANPSYDVYQHLWHWMQRNMTEGEPELLNHARIADAVKKDCKTELNPYDIAAAIDVMESQGLVNRGYRVKGELYAIDHKQLNGLRNQQGFNSKVLYAVGQKESPSMLNRRTLAKAAGLSSGYVSQQIRKLQEAEAISPQGKETSKTTIVHDLSGRIQDRLPKEVVDQKRDLDDERLEQMVEYAECTSHEECVSAIRNYFTAGDIRGKGE